MMVRHSASPTLGSGFASKWMQGETPHCPFAVLSGYMLDSDFIEFGNEVVDRMVIALEEGLPHLEFASDLGDYQLGVAFTCDLARPEVMS